MTSQIDNQIYPEDLVDELETTGALFDERKLRAFVCACCRLVWNKLPNIAQNALVLAEDYNRNLVSNERLIAERVKLWQFWQATPDHYNNPTTEAISVRAVICCLYVSIPKHEAFDTATAAMDFCNMIEPRQQEQYLLLQTIFNP